MSPMYDKKSARNKIIALVLVCALVLTGIVMVFWNYHKDTNKLFSDVKFAKAIAEAITASNKSENSNNYKTVNAVDITQEMLDEITGIIFTVNAVDSYNSYGPVVILAKQEYTDYYIEQSFASLSQAEDEKEDEEDEEEEESSEEVSEEASADESADASADTSADESAEASGEISEGSSEADSSVADESEADSSAADESKSDSSAADESKSDSSKDEEEEEKAPDDYYYVIYDLNDINDLKLFRNLKLIDMSGLNVRNAYQNIQQYYYYYSMFYGTSSDSNPYAIPAMTFTDPTVVDMDNITDLSVFYDISKLEYLSLGYSGLSSLEGIEKAQNLKFAELTACDLTDLSPLAGLNSVTHLNVSGNKLESLEGISANKDMQILYLGSCGLTSLEGLDGLTKLEGLDVSGNPLKNLSGFEDSKASLLNLYASQCRDTDIEIVEDESMDEEAAAAEAKKQRTLTDASALEGFTALKTVDLSYNMLDNIDFLASLESLTSATLADNEIKSVPESLAKLKKLTSFSAPDNEIASVAGLKDAKALTTLTLDNNKLTSLDGVGKLTKLTSLSAKGNEIADLGNLGGAKALTSLTLSENKISDLSQIAKLEKLTTLNLAGNDISDLSTLGTKLKAVTSLNLADNEKLVNLTGIENAFDKAKLTSIDLSIDGEANEKIEKWGPVYGYTKATVTGMTDDAEKEFDEVKKAESDDSKDNSSNASGSASDSSAASASDSTEDSASESAAE